MRLSFMGVFQFHSCDPGIALFAINRPTTRNAISRRLVNEVGSVKLISVEPL